MRKRKKPPKKTDEIRCPACGHEFSIPRHSLVEKRWENAKTVDRIRVGQFLKMARIAKHGYLLCSVCDEGMTRDQFGKYIHAAKRRKFDHEAQP